MWFCSLISDLTITVVTGCRHPDQVTIRGVWILQFAIYDPEIWIAGILLWFPLRVRIRAAEGFIFAVELRRGWGSQSANFIFRQFGQNHNGFFYKTEGVTTVFKLGGLPGSFMYGGSRVPRRIRWIFYKEHNSFIFFQKSGPQLMPTKCLKT